MEVRILTALDFKVCMPTAWQFMERLSGAWRLRSRHPYGVSRHLLCDFRQVRTSTSLRRRGSRRAARTWGAPGARRPARRGQAEHGLAEGAEAEEGAWHGSFKR